MKAVIDTNVLISGIFFTGPPSIVLEAWQNGKFDLFVSTEISDEYYRVAEELSHKFRNVNLKPVLDFIAARAIVIDSPVLQERLCTDPDDDKFFACAIAARAKHICSGDKSLLRASGYSRNSCHQAKDVCRSILVMSTKRESHQNFPSQNHEELLF